MKIGFAILLILGLTLYLFLPTFHFDFINFDDPYMVSGNPLLLGPLTWQTLFAPLSGLIHPLTNLTYWIDMQIYGMNPGGFHLTNVIFHLIAVTALFFWVYNLTKEALVAALLAMAFAWHPTHVESVAWITERKDVVAAAFFWLSLLSHSFTVGENKKVWWLATWVFAILSLMGKPLALGLPFILILIEWWKAGPPWSQKLSGRRATLILIPFVFLSIFFGLLNTWAQMVGRSALQERPLFSVLRLPQQLLFYAQKTFWPTDLKLIYSAADLAPSVLPILSFLVAAFFCFYFAYRSSSFRRDLVFGLSFFILIIAPALKMIPFGDESPVAERYLYVAQTGLLWPLARMTQISVFVRRILIPVFALVLTIWMTLSWQRLPAWKDGASMWASLLAVDPNSKLAHDHLAGVALSQEKMPEALTELQLGDTESLNNLINQGFVLLRLNRLDEADQKISKAELIKAKDPKVLNVRGLWFMQKQDWTQAKDFLELSIETPSQVLTELTRAETLSNLGVLAFRRGDLNECIRKQKEALDHSPNYVLAMYNLAFCQLQAGQVGEAEVNYGKTLQLSPSLAMAHHDLGVIALRRGQIEAGIGFFKKALEIDPRLEIAQKNLETALEMQKNSSHH